MRITDCTFTSDNKMIVTYFGTSGESKPTSNVAFGSLFYEVDTGKVYAFNETTSLWVEQ